tara:strand:- start:5697 stop:5879 length:183 start_codon:yes stop_codon:yes gene_type:complete
VSLSFYERLPGGTVLLLEEPVPIEKFIIDLAVLAYFIALLGSFVSMHDMTSKDHIFDQVR